MIKSLNTKSFSALRLSPTLEMKFSNETENGTVEGYASAFGGNPDSYGDIVQKGAFIRTLAEHRREGTMPAMLWSHDQCEPIGKWLEMHEDDFGLFVRGQLNLNSSRGRDAHAHLKNGDATGFSIGFYVSSEGRKQGTHGTSILTDVDLVEVSAVVFPANRRARVSAIKTLQSKSELIDLLRDGGVPKAAAARVAAGGWPALSNNDQRKAHELAELLDRATNQLRKI